MSSDFVVVQDSCICLPYELGKYIYGTPRTEDRIPDSWVSRILGIVGSAGSVPDELEMNIIILGQFSLYA